MDAGRHSLEGISVVEEVINSDERRAASFSADLPHNGATSSERTRRVRKLQSYDLVRCTRRIHFRSVSPGPQGAKGSTASPSAAAATVNEGEIFDTGLARGFSAPPARFLCCNPGSGVLPLSESAKDDRDGDSTEQDVLLTLCSSPSSSSSPTSLAPPNEMAAARPGFPSSDASMASPLTGRAAPSTSSTGRRLLLLRATPCPPLEHGDITAAETGGSAPPPPRLLRTAAVAVAVDTTTTPTTSLLAQAKRSSSPSLVFDNEEPNDTAPQALYLLSIWYSPSEVVDRTLDLSLPGFSLASVVLHFQAVEQYGSSPRASPGHIAACGSFRHGGDEEPKMQHCRRNSGYALLLGLLPFSSSSSPFSGFANSIDASLCSWWCPQLTTVLNEPHQDNASTEEDSSSPLLVAPWPAMGVESIRAAVQKKLEAKAEFEDRDAAASAAPDFFLLDGPGVSLGRSSLLSQLCCIAIPRGMPEAQRGGGKWTSARFPHVTWEVRQHAFDCVEVCTTATASSASWRYTWLRCDAAYTEGLHYFFSAAAAQYQRLAHPQKEWQRWWLEAPHWSVVTQVNCPALSWRGGAYGTAAGVVISGATLGAALSNSSPFLSTRTNCDTTTAAASMAVRRFRARVTLATALLEHALLSALKAEDGPQLGPRNEVLATLRIACVARALALQWLCEVAADAGESFAITRYFSEERSIAVSLWAAAPLFSPSAAVDEGKGKRRCGAANDALRGLMQNLQQYYRSAQYAALWWLPQEVPNGDAKRKVSGERSGRFLLEWLRCCRSREFPQDEVTREAGAVSDPGQLLTSVAHAVPLPPPLSFTADLCRLLCPSSHSRRTATDVGDVELSWQRPPTIYLAGQLSVAILHNPLLNAYELRLEWSAPAWAAVGPPTECPGGAARGDGAVAVAPPPPVVPLLLLVYAIDVKDGTEATAELLQATPFDWQLSSTATTTGSANDLRAAPWIDRTAVSVMNLCDLTSRSPAAFPAFQMHRGTSSEGGVAASLQGGEVQTDQTAGKTQRRRRRRRAANASPTPTATSRSGRKGAGRGRPRRRPETSEEEEDKADRNGGDDGDGDDDMLVLRFEDDDANMSSAGTTATSARPDAATHVIPVVVFRRDAAPPLLQVEVVDQLSIIQEQLQASSCSTDGQRRAVLKALLLHWIGVCTLHVSMPQVVATVRQRRAQAELLSLYDLHRAELNGGGAILLECLQEASSQLLLSVLRSLADSSASTVELQELRPVLVESLSPPAVHDAVCRALSEYERLDSCYRDVVETDGSVGGAQEKPSHLELPWSQFRSSVASYIEVFYTTVLWPADLRSALLAAGVSDISLTCTASAHGGGSGGQRSVEVVRTNRALLQPPQHSEEGQMVAALRRVRDGFAAAPIGTAPDGDNAPSDAPLPRGSVKGGLRLQLSNSFLDGDGASRQMKKGTHRTNSCICPPFDAESGRLLAEAAPSVTTLLCQCARCLYNSSEQVPGEESTAASNLRKRLKMEDGVASNVDEESFDSSWVADLLQCGPGAARMNPRVQSNWMRSAAGALSTALVQLHCLESVARLATP